MTNEDETKPAEPNPDTAVPNPLDIPDDGTNNQQTPDNTATPEDKQQTIDDTNNAPEDDAIPNPLADDSDDAKPKELTPEEEAKALEDYLKEAISEDMSDFNVGKNAYGDDIKLTIDEVKAIAPVLRKMGFEAKQVKDVATAFAAFDGARAKIQAQADREAYKAMADDMKQRFGNDYDRIRKEAIAGAKRVFSKEYWAQIQGIPVLTCSHEFVSAMARVGRLFARDDGTGGKASTAPQTDGFNLQEWLKTSR